jgi:hypothetical protein
VAGQRFNAERPLYGDEIQLASVGLGSMAGLRELHLDAVDLPVELKCHTADCATSGYLQWLTKVGFRPQ